MSDGPDRDPLDYAAENAARRYVCGEAMEAVDWDALKQKATGELYEFDNNQRF